MVILDYVGPKPTTGVLRRRPRKDTGAHGHMGGRPRDDAGRGCSDASTSRGMSRIADHHQKLEEARDRSFPGAVRASTTLLGTLTSDLQPPELRGKKPLLS